MFSLRQTERFSKWLLNLKDRLGKIQIVRRLDRLETGHFGDVKPVGDSVYEMRIHSGPGYRLYYCQQGDQIILLLCGGDKSSQEADIRTAKALVRDIQNGNDQTF